MLLAIDATNWIHVLYHAQHGQGVLTTLIMRLDALVARVKPSHVLACFDRRSFRHDLFPGYKAGRKPKDAELLRDLEEAPEALSAMASIVAEDGFEADDCLATIAAAGLQLGLVRKYVEYPASELKTEH